MDKILILGEKKPAMLEILNNAKALDDKKLLSLTKTKIDQEAKKGYIEGDKYILTWAMGHLYTIETPERVDPNYALFKPFKNLDDYKMLKLKDAPFVPDTLPSRYNSKYEKDRYNFAKNKKIQLERIEKLLKRKDIKEIILFADADAEGERIAREPVEGFFKTIPHLKKIKITRAWNTGSFKAKSAIEKALKERKSYLDSKYDNLFWSARARGKNDYIIGMKSSKVLSELYYKNLSTGRVQAPLLNIIYLREKEIENFKPKTFWKIKGKYQKLDFNHFYYFEDINDDGKPIKSKEFNYWDKDEVDEVIKKVKEAKLTGTVIESKTSKRKSTKPELYSSNTFHDDFIGKYGVTLENSTLAIEYLRDEGFTTYPRTNGHYFSTDDIEEVEVAVKTGLKLFKGIKIIEDNKKDIKVTKTNPIFNNKKAAKQNHTPLNITEKLPTEKDFKRWENVTYKGKKLKKLKEAYFLIAKRLFIHFLPDDLIQKENIVIDINSYLFEATGEKALIQGWRELTGELKKDTSLKVGDKKIAKGDKITLENIVTVEGTTKKPPKFTVKSLQRLMVNVGRALDEEILNIEDKEERKKKREEYKELKKIFKEIEGLGTEATRKLLIEKLAEKKNISIKGKKEEIELLPNGIFLVERLPDYLKAIKTTALWEIELEKIRRGEIKYTNFIDSVDNTYINIILPQIIKKYKSEKDVINKPSEKQLKFAKSIAEKLKISIPEKALKLKKELSKWIDENSKKLPKDKVNYSLSEKQKNIFRKNDAPKTILKLIEKENLTSAEFKKCKTWLDNFFKKLKSKKG